MQYALEIVSKQFFNFRYSGLQLGLKYDDKQLLILNIDIWQLLALDINEERFF